MDVTKISEPQASSGIGRLIRAFAPVKRSELITVVLLTINVFTVMSCYYVLKVVREPLIMGSKLTIGSTVITGAEFKSYSSGGQALLLLAIIPAFSWLSSRVSRVRLLTTMQVIFIACLIGFSILVEAGAPIGLPFFLWVGIFNVFVVSNFWSFANDLYSEEEGKRLFAIIGLGASIGAIVGAFVPHLLERTLGTQGLMLVAVAGLCVSIALYRWADLRERGKQRAAKVSAPPAIDKKGGFSLVLKDRYLRLLAGMLVVATIINTSGEYVIGEMASQRADVYAAEQVAAHAHAPAPTPTTTVAPPTEAATPAAELGAAKKDYLTKFYADYYGLVNLFSMLIQGLLVARLLTKLGVRRALFIMPVIVLGGWLALIMYVSMIPVRIEKTTENSLDYSLHNTLRQALFLPTSREAKYKAKAAIDTFFFRIGDAIAGLGIVVLLVEVLGLGVRSFAIMNVGLAVAWLVLAARAGRLHDQLAAEQANAPEATPTGA